MTSGEWKNGLEEPDDRSSVERLEALGVHTLARILHASLDGIAISDAARRFIYVNPAMADLLGYSPEDVVGRDLTDMIASRLRNEMRQNHSMSLSGQPGRRSSVLLRPDGDEREIEYTNVVLMLDGQPAVASISRDVTETRRQAREATALARVAGELTLDQTLRESIDALAARVVEATNAVACVVGVIDEESIQLRTIRAHGLADGFAQAMEATWDAAKARNGPSIRAFRTQETQLSRNSRDSILANPDFAPLHEFVRDAAWLTFIATPIVYRGRSLGVLLTYHLEEPGVNDAEIAFLKSIADQAAVAYANSELMTHAQENAVLEERQRLSRELHDSVSQALYGIALGARTARTLLDRDPERVAEPLDYVLSLAEAGLAEMRALIFELRPETMETDGMVVAIQRQVEAVRARHGLDVELVACDEPDLPVHVKQALYRIAQEALNNVVKHARATEITLRLDREVDNFILEIRDNGAGFDPMERFPGHLGLDSMRERVAQIGGQIDIHSRRGEGTSIRVTLPRVY